MSNLNELLQQLAEAAPEVCRALAYSDGPAYVIGDYSFWVNSLGEFEAKYKMSTFFVRGDPAHAWLQGALQAEITRRGWFFVLRSQPADKGGIEYYAQVGGWVEYRDEATLALLTAFIAALGAATSPAPLRQPEGSPGVAGDAGAK